VGKRRPRQSGRPCGLTDGDCPGALITVDVLVHPQIVGIRVRSEHEVKYRLCGWPLLPDGTVIYYAHGGDEAIARAVVEVFKGCISDVLVYKESDRRKGIGSALYKRSRPTSAGHYSRAGSGRRLGESSGQAGADGNCAACSESPRAAFPPTLIALRRRGQHLRKES
jgi:hypothetical protein